LERKIVIAIRLGESIPLLFHWFYKSKPIGTKIKINLDHGDIYIMNEKAVGTDGYNKTIPILKHATGYKKYGLFLFKFFINFK
jgi:hypothetical protein